MMPEPTDEAIVSFYADLGRNIRDARVRTGSTQAQIGSRVAMTRSSIANIEAGRQRVPVHILSLIAAVLDVPADSLISPDLLTHESSGFEGLAERLENEDPSTRDFVEGAIAQLGLRSGKDE